MEEFKSLPHWQTVSLHVRANSTNLTIIMKIIFVAENIQAFNFCTFLCLKKFLLQKIFLPAVQTKLYVILPS